VVVCTRDRPAALVACLRSLADEPADEVLVVDNGTTSAAVPAGVRVVVEPEVGLSAARNRGLATATGDVVLFLDDDVTAVPGLVDAHRRAHDAGAVAAGGPVRAALAHPRPRWLDPRLDDLLSVVDRGAAPRELGIEEPPYGANLSVDRAAALGAGGFDTGLGRRDRNLASGEEDDLLRRLVAAGGRLRWCPDAIVDHHLGSERLRVAWFARRAWAQGTSDSALRRRWEPQPRRRELTLALRLAWTAVRPGGTWPAGGPPPLPRRAVVELVRRIRLLGAALGLVRR
jgi:GT2 family glycosyltransferase